MVIDEGKIVCVELGRQIALSDRHPYAVGEALAERPRRHLHTRCEVVLRVSGRLAPPLAKIFQLPHRQVVAGEVEQSV